MSAVSPAHEYDVYHLTGAGGRRYEVSVSTPITYGRGQKRYPVLYVLDGNLLFGGAVAAARMLSLGAALFPDAPLPVGGIPEMIVVGIGYPGDNAEHKMTQWYKGRCYDFSSRIETEGEGARHQELFRSLMPDVAIGGADGGAEAFLRLLTEQMQSLVTSRYRVDREKHILYGGSAAGYFAAFTLVSAPETFTHYIIASPALYICGEHVFEIEAARAAAKQALPAQVFLSFGSREVDLYATSSIAASTTRFAQVLLMRNYPGLDLHTYVFPDESHHCAGLYALPRGLNTLLTNSLSL